MSDFLTQMSEESRRRARAVRDIAGRTGLDRRVEGAVPPTSLELSEPSFDIIAEAKLASPSEGRLIVGPTAIGTVADLARAYADAGARAVSVLTEETRFHGDLAHLEAVSREIPVPVMRKDFLVDPIQVLEARACGASGVLLIARMLPGGLLAEMTDLALALGMFVLIEAFDRTDLETAARVFDREVLVGVNCRDLSTLELEPSRFATLAPHLPDHLPTVAESGMATADDVAAVAMLGYRLALVGSSLVSDPDPAAKLGGLIAAGRRALAGAAS